MVSQGPVFPWTRRRRTATSVLLKFLVHPDDSWGPPSDPEPFCRDDGPSFTLRALRFPYPS